MIDKSSKQQVSGGAQPDGARRAIVAVAASTPLIAAAVALFRRRPAETVAPLAAPGVLPPADNVGYHETEHIRRYYRSTKL